MARYKFYNIYLVPVRGVSKNNIEQVLNLSIDWFHYGRNNWVVYSTSSKEKWMQRFRPLIGNTGHLFISEIRPEDCHGWMPVEFWNWLKVN